MLKHEPQIALLLFNRVFFCHYYVQKQALSYFALCTVHMYNTSALAHKVEKVWIHSLLSVLLCVWEIRRQGCIFQHLGQWSVLPDRCLVPPQLWFKNPSVMMLSAEDGTKPACSSCPFVCSVHTAVCALWRKTCLSVLGSVLQWFRLGTDITWTVSSLSGIRLWAPFSVEKLSA